MAVATGFVALFAVVAVRAGQLTVVHGQRLAGLAQRQQHRQVDFAPVRGPIVDRRGEPLALTLGAQSLYLRPADVRQHSARLPKLAALLGIPEQEVRKKAESKASFVWLRRHASPHDVEAALALGIEGVGSVPERRRVYPRAALAVHVLGFAGVDAQGLEGVERSYEEFIRPPIHLVDLYRRDARGGRMLVSAEESSSAPIGAQVELTIDATLQALVERELQRAVTAADAAGGSAVVLEPHTGAVLALANAPSFDPNNIGESPMSARRNRAITDIYEPGSTFKAILTAAALDRGTFAPHDRIFCEEGRYKVGRRSIRDHHPHGWLTLAEVVRYSSNIGTAKVAEKLGPDQLYAYARAFGFGEKTGIDLPGEVSGLVRDPSGWKPIDLATASFGQGIAATPLQVARAFASIANGGELVRPHVVARIVGADGAILLDRRPARGRRVMKRSTAETLTKILREVVEGEGGTGQLARLEGIAVAGKTGTSQKVDPETGTYSPSARIASFVGFVPADRPQAVILVAIDEPKGSPYGGIVAAPVFREIAAGFLARVGVERAGTGQLREVRERSGGVDVGNLSGMEPRAG